MRILDPADLVDGPVDAPRSASSDASSSPRAGGDRVEPGAPRVAQVGDVRPLVLDLLAELAERGVGVEGAVDEVADRLGGTAVAYAAGSAARSSGGAERSGAGGRARSRGWPSGSSGVASEQRVKPRRARSSQARE